MIKAPTDLQDCGGGFIERRSRTSLIVSGGSLCISQRSKPSTRPTVSPSEIVEPPASIVKASPTSRHRDSTHFLRKSGKNSYQVVTNPSRTVGLTFQRPTASSAHFKYPAFAIAWCRER